MADQLTADVHIAVHGRNGSSDELVAALEAANLDAETPDNLREWAAKGGRRAVILGIDDAEALDAVVDIRDESIDLVMVTLTPDGSQASYRRALLAGATATAPADATPEELVDVVRQAVEGRAILPTEVARRLALDAPERPTHYAPSMDEIGWVQAMAGGATIADLAEQSDCSKSEMTKRLNGLYERVGVENRTEAFIKFARWGLLD